MPEGKEERRKEEEEEVLSARKEEGRKAHLSAPLFSLEDGEGRGKRQSSIWQKVGKRRRGEGVPYTT